MLTQCAFAYVLGNFATMSQRNDMVTESYRQTLKDVAGFLSRHPRMPASLHTQVRGIPWI